MNKRVIMNWLLCLFPFYSMYAHDTHWRCDIHGYQYDMTMYVELSLDGNAIVSEGYEVAAFCGDECRGVATVETITGTDKAYYYLRVRSNVTEGETITFKYYHIATEKEVAIDETIGFVSQSALGYPSNPFTLTKSSQYEIKVLAGDNGEVTGGGVFGKGSEVRLTAIPNEGYRFVEWSDGTKDNPYVFIVQENKEISASFATNKYEITYIIDEEIIHKDSIEYGKQITVIDAPDKEGYTFSGWGEAPETMPAEDVIISGTFIVNKYLVTFKIGDDVIAADSLEYGAAIVAPEASEKEGHTFNGWGEVVETVPANDVTIEGSYSVNSYLLSYVVDGETVQSDSVAYGTAITLLDEPTKEGYTFSGWSEAPKTMPANDVTISGTFTVNIYKVYYYVDKELVHTAEVAYGEAIPEYTYVPTGEGDIFEGWIGETYETMPAHDVTYTANITNGIAHSTLSPQRSTIYDLSGRKVTNTENLKGGVYIINGRKVVIK